MLAAGGESAAGEWFREVGGHTGDRVEFGAFGLKRRDRALEGARVGMAGRMEERAGVGGFDDAAGIHDLDAVTEPGDDAEIVRDEDHGHAELPLHLFDQLENLRLHGDVECGRGFVGDEELGLGDEGHRDHDALTHASGKLVRVEVDAFVGVVDADGFEGGEGALAGCGLGEIFVDEQRLHELVADPHVGIQGGHGILENHRDAFSADGTGLGGCAVEQIDAIENGGAALDAAGGRRDEAHDGVARD